MAKHLPLVFVLAIPMAAAPARAGDWAAWRGPTYDGRAAEHDLATRWSPAGENLAWHVAIGSRSSPIVLGDRLFVLATAGASGENRERLLCLDANTGRQLFDYGLDAYFTDREPGSAGWAAPAGDPESGNVYVFGGGGRLLAFGRTGKLAWERSLAEEFGLRTGASFQPVPPIVVGDLVIVSGATSGWGDEAELAERFLAFDKITGETAWVSSPAGRARGASSGAESVADSDGTRLLIAGGSDGAVHAIDARTGEDVWSFPLSRRALAAGVTLEGSTAFVSQGDEGDPSAGGSLLALDVRGRGTVGASRVRWRNLTARSSGVAPLIDAGRVYATDDEAGLLAFDAETGRRLWQQRLGSLRKTALVFADGKLYVGSASGSFFIVRPGPTGAEVLSEVHLGAGALPEAVLAPPAVAAGRIYVASSRSLYAIGRKGALAKPFVAQAPPAEPAGEPSLLQVRPAEATLRPGAVLRFRARLYDARGRFVREEPSASWSLDQLKGNVTATGELALAPDLRLQAGAVKASLGSLTGAARVRVFPAPPSFTTFDWLDKVPPAWIAASGGYALRERKEGKVLVKLDSGPLDERGRVFFGPSDMHDYTIAADVLAQDDAASGKVGEAGVIAERRGLVLRGSTLELTDGRGATAPGASAALDRRSDTWYRLKLRVESLPDGRVRARGKAWPTLSPEPEAWLVEALNPAGNRQGSPGLFAAAPAEVWFDDVSVVQNDAALAAGRRDASLFEYDTKLPPDLQETGSFEKAGLTVHDLTYANLAGGRTAAYLVVPEARGPHPAVLFVHWYEPHSPDSNRTQFLDEAVDLAKQGVVSLLIATPWSEPDWFSKRDATEDYATSVAEVKELRRALDVLLAVPDLDASRVAYVGHDFGAMYGGVLAGVDHRATSFALQAGTGFFPDWFFYAPPRLGAARQAFLEQMAPLEPAAYVAAAAPAALFFQFGATDPHVPRERAEAFFAAATEPKQVAFYDAGHAMNDAARRDRLAWLRERLQLREP